MSMETNDTRDPGSHDEHAIRALYHDLLESWNERDAGRFASLFTGEGYIVGFDGSMNVGPAEIESTLGEIFAHHPTATFIERIRAVIVPVSDTAVLRAVVGMVPRGGSDINPAVNAVQSLVAVRREDRWLIALFQNTPAALHGRPEASEALTGELREELRARRDAKSG